MTPMSLTRLPFGDSNWLHRALLYVDKPISHGELDIFFVFSSTIDSLWSSAIRCVSPVRREASQSAAESDRLPEQICRWTVEVDTESGRLQRKNDPKKIHTRDSFLLEIKAKVIRGKKKPDTNQRIQRGKWTQILMKENELKDHFLINAILGIYETMTQFYEDCHCTFSGYLRNHRPSSSS